MPYSAAPGVGDKLLISALVLVKNSSAQETWRRFSCMKDVMFLFASCKTLPGDVHRIWTKCSYPAMPGTTLLMRTQRRAWCLGLLCVTVGTGCLRRHWIRLCCLYLIG